jgi:putative membrane protein
MDKRIPNMQLLWRLLINTAALWAATRVVPGISYTGDWRLLLGVALVFGVLNTLVRPVLKLLTFPLLILTLGLFTFVLNAIMLWLTSVASDALGLGFRVTGFRAAFLGALVVSIVSFALSLLLISGRSEDDRRTRDTGR